jgi:hypothetical protein
MTDGFIIGEINMDTVRFFHENKNKLVFQDVHFSARVENSKVLLRFYVTINDKHFDYTLNPSVESGKSFCKTGKVTIRDPKENDLAVITMDKNQVIKRLSQIPQCKEWIEK